MPKQVSPIRFIRNAADGHALASLATGGLKWKRLSRNAEEGRYGSEEVRMKGKTVTGKIKEESCNGPSKKAATGPAGRYGEDRQCRI
jgi:hypothetical protein